MGGVREDILSHFEFEHLSFFALLPLVICFYKCPSVIKKTIFPHTRFFGKRTSLINKEKLLNSLIFTLLLSALAKPVSYDAKIANNRKGRDLVFVLDTSGSMNESGYSKEENDLGKFDILKNLIGAFITKRHDDNVGVCVFGTFAFCSVPLTYDTEAVRFLLRFLEVGIAGESTAIGDGLWSALDSLAKGDAKEKVILLLTDGYQNSGAHSIAQAVERAKKTKTKIYTVGIGEKSDYDANLLDKIAQQTHAKSFQAKNAKELEAVYEELDTLEPSPIRSQGYLNRHELFTFALAAAFLLLLFLLHKKART